MDLVLTARTDGPVTIVTVDGDVDVTSAARLGECLDMHIGAGRHQLVLELQRVSFLDSMALGVLVGRVRLARLRQGSVQVVCTVPRLLRLLDITGLHEVLPVHDHVEDAVRACRTEELVSAGSLR